MLVDLHVWRFLESPQDLVILLLLFKLIIIEGALEFEEGRIIDMLLPMILYDFDNFDSLLLTIFLRNAESLTNQVTRIDKWHQEVRMLSISSSSIVARVYQLMWRHTIDIRACMHATSADTISMQIS